MVSRISLHDLLEDLPHVPCQQITRARPEVLATVPVVVLSGSDACLHVCRARLNMLVQPQTALDELPRAVDVPTLTVSFRPVGRVIFLSLTYVGCCHVHTPPTLMRFFWWTTDPWCTPRTFCLYAFALSVSRMICLSLSHLSAMVRHSSFRIGPGPSDLFLVSLRFNYA